MGKSAVKKQRRGSKSFMRYPIVVAMQSGEQSRKRPQDKGKRYNKIFS